MTSPNTIKYLKRKDIDIQKWNQCIGEAANGMIYSYSFYLDTMAKHWDALVLNDYDAVMPLTWNQKWNIKYLYQPFLSAQLGIIGNQLSEELIKKFIDSIPATYMLIDIPLNFENIIIDKGLFERANYVLPLSVPYEQLAENYNENTQRNIKKAAKLSLEIKRDIDVNDFITLALRQIEKKDTTIKDNMNRFRSLYRELAARKMVRTYGVYNQSGLIASCVFFFSRERAYYILAGNDKQWATTGASHFLIDQFIRDYAGSGITLDFEGSDIPGIARFYRGFGANPEPYTALYLNRLPRFIRWMKKR